MPATPIRRHRLSASLAGVVLGIGVLAGCAGQRAPGNYNDSVERDFVKQCTKTAEGGPGASFDAPTYCQCAYNALSADDGIDFDEFKRVNDDQTEDPGSLPAEFTDAFASCPTESGGGSASTTAEGSGDTTTTGG